MGFAQHVAEAVIEADVQSYGAILQELEPGTAWPIYMSLMHAQLTSVGKRVVERLGRLRKSVRPKVYICA